MQYTQATLAGQPIRLANLFFSSHTQAQIPGVGAYHPDGQPGSPELDAARRQELLELLREHTRLNLDNWTRPGTEIKVKWPFHTSE